MRRWLLPMEPGRDPVLEGTAAFARDKGVKLAVEACGGQLVHLTSTMLRLIEATDADVVGANLDPSHLMWMGADIPTVIRTLGDAILHVHAKDIRNWVSARDGLLDTVPITESDSRAWNYVTLGLGHPDGATFWADFVSNLRAVGYDGGLNIEHEDALVNSLEGGLIARRPPRRDLPAVSVLPDLWWRYREHAGDCCPNHRAVLARRNLMEQARFQKHRQRAELIDAPLQSPTDVFRAETAAARCGVRSCPDRQG